MIRSMTAFASSERPLNGWLCSWELRTVNHRFLDIAPRLPDSFRFLEVDIRARIGQVLKRGRVDCTLVWKKAEAGDAVIRVNPALVAQLLAAAQAVESQSPVAMAPLNALQVLQWPGVLHQPETDREQLAAHVLALLDEALEKLVACRAAEGQQLATLIETRCLAIQNLVTVARARLPAVLQANRNRVLTRLAEITATPDQDRLEQEMVYLAQKLDIAEELDRLETHVKEALRSLKQKEPVGRRLDFLLQEFNREANTIGSKSADAETSRISMEIKVLIEQAREQVQNVE